MDSHLGKKGGEKKVNLNPCFLLGSGLASYMGTFATRPLLFADAIQIIGRYFWPDFIL